MDLKSHLMRLKHRQLIDDEIIAIVLKAEALLAQKWKVNVQTEQVVTLLVHFANALGRIKRQHCASPLHKDFLQKIQSAVCFPTVLAIHQDILQLVPFTIPDNEQTYFLANYYALLLDQPQIALLMNEP